MALYDSSNPCDMSKSPSSAALREPDHSDLDVVTS